MTDSNDLLPAQFQFLITELGFRIVESKVYPSFDNTLVRLANSALNVRVSRDRGFSNAEVSPHAEPDKWQQLAWLLKIVQQGTLWEPTIEEQAEFLQSNYSTVVELLSPQNFDDTNERILQAGRERVERLYPGRLRDR